MRFDNKKAAADKKAAKPVTPPGAPIKITREMKKKAKMNL